MNGILNLDYSRIFTSLRVENTNTIYILDGEVDVLEYLLALTASLNAMMTYRIILISKLRQTHPVEGASLPITFIQISIHLLINYTR